MSTFVDECRREWKRLGVPDSIAEDMAAELDADLEEAGAEGVAAAEILGESDPRRFAAGWASARGLVPEPDADRPRRRPLWAIVAAVLIVLVIGVIVGAVLVVDGAHPSLHTSIHTPARPPHGAGVALPNLVGLKQRKAFTVLARLGLAPRVVFVRRRPPGEVVAQAPSAGVHVRRGAAILLRVARAG